MPRRFSGHSHSAMMEKKTNDWQDYKTVLARFGSAKVWVGKSAARSQALVEKSGDLLLEE